MLRGLLEGHAADRDQTPRGAYARSPPRNALFGYEGAEVASVVSREVAGVPCIVITPRAGPLPVLVWFHGGGWV